MADELNYYSEVVLATALANACRGLSDIEEIEAHVDCPERIAANEFIAYVSSRWAGPRALRVIIDPVSEADLGV